MVIERDVAVGGACDTGPVTRAELLERWRALWRRTSAAPRLSRWAWAADAILAVAMLVGVLDGALNPSSPDQPIPSFGPSGPPDPPDPPGPPGDPARDGIAPLFHYPTVHWWHVALGVLTVLPLVTRRRFPLATFWTVIVATLLYHATSGFDPTFTFTACVIAAYSAVMNSAYPGIAMVSALIGAGLLIEDHSRTVPSLRPELVLLVLLIPIALVANAIHTWKLRVRRLEEEQVAATRLAVERERARIASELHDVVTHNVSVMVVQAGAARKVMDVSPERAKEALLAVEAGGRAAMTDLRHVMGLLTMGRDLPMPPADPGGTGLAGSGLVGAPAGLAFPEPADLSEDSLGSAGLDPAPGLDQLPALVDRVRDIGVPVELTVTGVPAALPPGVDLTAYRVVQEAMTNTVKHAVGARVRVTVDHGVDELRVDVTDTGGTPAVSARLGNGRGLAGLRERLAVYGGTLESGEERGGYRVRAVIPVDGS
jgi:signal transduction histidine kinase